MLIGVTYDLRDDYLHVGFDEEEAAEFDGADTVAAIEAALQSLGHSTDPIGHVRALAARLTAGDRWDLVFNIAEGSRGFGREAQVPALLEAFEVPYTFSDPLVLAVALHKPTAKRILRDLGIATPAFVVIENLADIGRVDLPYPLFVKPVAEGSSKGISPASKARDPAALRAACASLLARFAQPVIVEAFLPGREFTVGILGTGPQARALGALEVHLQVGADPEIYTYENKRQYESRIRYALAEDAVAGRAIELALAAWRGLGCRDGGRVDLRCDADGMVNVLEVNPLAGLNPEHSDIVILGRILGVGHRDLVGAIVESAMRRIGEPRGRDLRDFS